ncbi:ATP-dependent Clp protease ATP-binding subunit CLPT2, chloroplastic [Linum grandiflorum]
MASSTLSSLRISSSLSRSSSEHNLPRTVTSSLSPFSGNKLPIPRLSSSNVVLKCRRPRVATVSATLPTKEYTDRAKIPKWSSRSIRSYGLAELEARKLKYGETGTECLLLGILIEGTSAAAKFLRANGATTYKIRDEIVNMLGKRYFLTLSPEFPPPTEQALRALDNAIEETLKSGNEGEVTPSHVLLAIWSDTESVAHELLKTLGFTDEKMKELTHQMDNGAAVLSSVS